MRHSHGRTMAQIISDVEAKNKSQHSVKLPVSRPPLSISDFKPGFIYQAWVGYEWIEVEYGKTGFSKEHLAGAIRDGLVRRAGGG